MKLTPESWCRVQMTTGIILIFKCVSYFNLSSSIADTDVSNLALANIEPGQSPIPSEAVANIIVSSDATHHIDRAQDFNDNGVNADANTEFTPTTRDQIRLLK